MNRVDPHPTDEWTLKQYKHMLANLAQIRSEMGLSLRALAYESDVHFNTLQRWEHGDSTPDTEPLCRVAKALHDHGYRPPVYNNSHTIAEMRGIMRQFSSDLNTTRNLKVTTGAVEHWRREGTMPPFKTMLHVEDRLHVIETAVNLDKQIYGKENA